MILGEIWKKLIESFVDDHKDFSDIVTAKLVCKSWEIMFNNSIKKVTFSKYSPKKERNFKPYVFSQYYLR